MTGDWRLEISISAKLRTGPLSGILEKEKRDDFEINVNLPPK